MTRALTLVVIALAGAGCHVLAFGDIPCDVDAACPHGLVCDNGACVDEDSVSEGEGDGGEGEGDGGEGEGDVSECSDADPCPGGGTCGRGRCYPPCTDDTDCDPAAACQDTACVPRCNQQDDCAADEVCLNFGLFEAKTLCVVGCRSDASCSGTDLCDFDFFCEPPLGDGSEFASCHAEHECDAPFACLADFSGNTYCTTGCDAFADPPVDCSGGLSCDFNTCIEKCDGCTFDCCPITGFTCDAESHDCVP